MTVLSCLRLTFALAIQLVSLLSISLRGHLAPHAVVLGVDRHAISATSHDVILVCSSYYHSIHQILVICFLDCWILIRYLLLVSIMARSNSVLSVLLVIGLKRLREQIPWSRLAFLRSIESSKLSFPLFRCNSSLGLQIHILNSFE